MEASTDRMVTFHIPEDPALLAAFGRVGLRHSQLDHMLRMTIKSLSGVSIPEAMDETMFQGSKLLRSRITMLAKSRLGDGKSFIQLQALLERCRATEKRNALIHNVWARELGGEFLIRGEDHDWKAIPTADTLNELAQEILQLAVELNTARLKGFLAEALAVRK